MVFIDPSWRAERSSLSNSEIACVKRLLSVMDYKSATAGTLVYNELLHNLKTRTRNGGQVSSCFQPELYVTDAGA